MDRTKKLGDLLKEAGLINDFQLQTALSNQSQWGGKLGVVLVELKFAREEDIARVISEKLSIPYINLFEPKIPDEVISLIKPEVAKKYQVIPAKKEANTLLLAMSDPLDIDAIDTIRFITGLNIKPLLAMASEIKDAISLYYDKEDVPRTKGHRSFVPRGSLVDDGDMEIIWGSDLNMSRPDGSNAPSAILSREEKELLMPTGGPIRIDELITLLIEKGLITREDIVSIIYRRNNKL